MHEHQTLLDNILSFDLDCLHGIFDHIPNGIAITNSEANIIFANRNFSRVTGYSFNEVLNKNLGMLYSGRHDQAFYEEMWGKVMNEGFWQGEIWNRSKGGKIYPEQLTINRVTSAIENKVYYVAIFNEVSFIREDKNNEYNLAFYDALTLLPNARLLKDRFEQIKNNLERVHHDEGKQKTQTAIVLIDLDNFDAINYKNGFVVGDMLLQHVADVLKKTVRKVDTVARVGSDKFAVIIPTLKEPEGANIFYNRLQKNLSRNVTLAGNNISIEASIGITFYPGEADNYDEVFQQANQALHYAKKNKLGKCFYKDLQH